MGRLCPPHSGEHLGLPHMRRGWGLSMAGSAAWLSHTVGSFLLASEGLCLAQDLVFSTVGTSSQREELFLGDQPHSSCG